MDKFEISDEFDIPMDALENSGEFEISEKNINISEEFVAPHNIIESANEFDIPVGNILNFDAKTVSDRPSFGDLKQSNSDNNIQGHSPDNALMSDEKVEILFENDLVKVERIFSLGHHTNDGMWYNIDMTESVKITRGEAILTVGSKMLNLIEGDAVIIAAGEKHRVDFATDDCEWLCMYFKI